MRKVVLDIETKNTFQEVGKNDPRALDISVLVIYDSLTDQYEAFEQKDFLKLWKILEEADMIIGYNSDYFDIPLLNKYYPGDLTQIKSLDLLSEIKNSFGKRVGLDMVAAGTLGKNKIGQGLQAVRWWQEGEIEKIKKYCEEDVRITKEIYDYARENGHVKYKLLNDIYTIALDVSKWEEKRENGGMNYTLPF